MPCTCEVHKHGAEIKIDNHIYRVEEREGPGDWVAWRYRCSCGKASVYQYQSDAVCYHQWLNHVRRAALPKPASRPA